MPPYQVWLWETINVLNPPSDPDMLCYNTDIHVHAFHTRPFAAAHSIHSLVFMHTHARWPRTAATRNMHDPRAGAAALPRTDRDAHRDRSPC
eukprot:8364-Prymnesium_polylepis.1